MSKGLTQVARDLRNNLTEAEKHLWYGLRLNNLGVKFRRQVVIGRYIADFVCFEKKLVIEVDGGQHRNSQKDEVRDEWLRREGFKVLRFWNNDVLKNRDGVLRRIIEHLSPSLTLPTGGREVKLLELSVKKKFDAVQMARDIRDKIYKETRHMSQEEYLTHIRKGSKKLHDELSEQKTKRCSVKH